jgi:hypothetical protein
MAIVRHHHSEGIALLVVVDNDEIGAPFLSVQYFLGELALPSLNEYKPLDISLLTEEALLVVRSTEL